MSAASKNITQLTSVVRIEPITAIPLDQLDPSSFLTTLKNYFLRPETNVPMITAVLPITMLMMIYINMVVLR